jgi:hypothetical protein
MESVRIQVRKGHFVTFLRPKEVFECSKESVNIDIYAISIKKGILNYKLATICNYIYIPYSNI